VGESRLSSRSVEMHRRAVNRRHERHAKALFLQNTGRILVDRLRRPAEGQLDTVPIRPVIEGLRGELCAVVDADALGQRPRGRDV